MKKLILLLCIISSTLLLAQKTNPDFTPFSVIEEVPVFPGCDKGDNYQKKNCLNSEMRRHIAKNFNIKIVNKLGLEGGKCIKFKKRRKGKKECVEFEPKKYRIYLTFKIDYDGSVFDIKARGPHPKLEKEAIRVAKLIPKMKPGKQRGKPVRVGYTLPITFNVE